jgi:hypothetical protein
MAAVEHAENLRVREDFFVTFDENTDNLFFGCLTRTPADFLTAEFFVCPVLPTFDLCFLFDGSDCVRH